MRTTEESMARELAALDMVQGGEFSRRLGIPEGTFWSRVRRRKIPAPIRVGRSCFWPREIVERVAQEQR